MAIRKPWKSRWIPKRRFKPAMMPLGGKTRTNAAGEVAEKGWDHDPPAKEKVVPSGILVLLTGVLTLIFGNKETSDAWVDALRMWWRQARSGPGHVKRLVIDLDNGPKNSGRRTQILKHMVQFADETDWPFAWLTFHLATASTIESYAAGRLFGRNGTADC